MQPWNRFESYNCTSNIFVILNRNIQLTSFSMNLCQIFELQERNNNDNGVLAILQTVDESASLSDSLFLRHKIEKGAIHTSHLRMKLRFGLKCGYSCRLFCLFLAAQRVESKVSSRLPRNSHSASYPPFSLSPPIPPFFGHLPVSLHLSEKDLEKNRRLSRNSNSAAAYPPYILSPPNVSSDRSSCSGVYLIPSMIPFQWILQ